MRLAWLYGRIRAVDHEPNRASASSVGEAVHPGTGGCSGRTAPPSWVVRLALTEKLGMDRLYPEYRLEANRFHLLRLFVFFRDVEANIHFGGELLKGNVFVAEQL